jgi:hypothetical protein
MSKIDKHYGVTRSPVSFDKALTLAELTEIQDRMPTQPISNSYREKYKANPLTLEERRFNTKIRDINNTLGMDGRYTTSFYADNADVYKKLAALYHYYGWIVTISLIDVAKQKRTYYELKIWADEEEV